MVIFSDYLLDSTLEVMLLWLGHCPNDELEEAVGHDEL